jgi:hypothetical protein
VSNEHPNIERRRIRFARRVNRVWRRRTRRMSAPNGPTPEHHETRGNTRNARRRIDLDPTTVEVLVAWRQWQRTEQAAAVVYTHRGLQRYPHQVY